MKKAITFLFICCSFALLGQQSYFVCGKVKYNQSGQKYRYETRYYDAATINKMPEKDTSVINTIKKQIFLRAGNEFYKRLEPEGIAISVHPEKCNNIKYTFRYVFKIDSTFYYLFSLTYDKNGRLVGNEAFPSVQGNKDFYTLLPPCTIIDSVEKDTAFTNFYKSVKTGNISRVSIAFNQEENCFVYEITGIILYPESFGNNKTVSGTWYRKNLLINAQTGKVIKVTDDSETRTINVDTFLHERNYYIEIQN